jgi:hypothetical protein
VTVDGGPGSDDLSVPAGALDRIAGPLDARGGGDNDSLTVDDSGRVAAGSYKLGPAEIAGPGGLPISYSGLASLTILAGQGDNRFAVSGTPEGTAVTVDCGGGLCSFNLGDASSVQGILGSLTIKSRQSGTTLNIDDCADTEARVVTMSTLFPADSSGPLGVITGLAPAMIAYQSGGTSRVYLMTGTGADTINVFATSVPTSLNSRGGDDLLNVGDAGILQGILGGLTVDNQRSNTTLKVDDSSDTTGRVVNLMTSGGGHQPWGTLTGLAPADIVYRPNRVSVSLLGGLGDDTFALGKGASLPGSIDGGGGWNLLDYSACGGPFQVTLPVDDGMGTATGVRDGIYHIQDYIPRPLASPSAYGRADVHGAALEALMSEGVTPLSILPTDPALAGGLVAGTLTGKKVKK